MQKVIKRPASMPCLERIASRQGVMLSRYTEESVLRLYDRHQILIGGVVKMGSAELRYVRSLARKYNAQQLLNRLEYVN